MYKTTVMKKALFFMLPLYFSLNAIAQADYRVVFDFTSKDSIDQKSVIRWINGITKGEPNAKVEVVMYGQGINLVVKGRSFVSEDVLKLAANKNVSFKVCSVALQNLNVDKSQLLDGVGTVPDGIYEIITKQREGWGYIKVKN
jgi:uncharacterized protein